MLTLAGIIVKFLTLLIINKEQKKMCILSLSKSLVNFLFL